MHIFRGLLWNQETAISRGIQANYTAGPVALSGSWNDGFYSNRYNWLSGSAAWTISSTNTLALVVAGNLGTTDYSNSLATPIVQNNDQQLDNLIYSYVNGAWILQGYVQYAEAKANAALGYTHSGSTTGWGVLANYAVPNTSVNLSGRVEYISSSGQPDRRLAEPPLRSGQQRLVVHVHALLPVRGALHPRRGVHRADGQRHRRPGPRAQPDQPLPVPLRGRGGHPVLIPSARPTAGEGISPVS